MNNAWSIALRAPCALKNAGSIHSTFSLSYSTVSTSRNLSRSFHNAWKPAYSRCDRMSTITPHNSDARRAFSCSTWSLKAKGGSDPSRERRKRATVPQSEVPSNSASTPSQTNVDWRSYKDEDGIPLPNGKLKPIEIQKLFSTTSDPAVCNRILRIIQYRRVSGSLAEYGFRPTKKLELDESIAAKALEWLREQYPMDEEAAAARWTEEEAIRIERELRARSQTLGIYKDDAEAKDAPTMQGTEYGQRYGISGLESIRLENERKYDEDLQREAEQKKQANSAVTSSGPQSVQLSKGDQATPSLLPSLAKAREYSKQKNVAHAEKLKKFTEKATITKDPQPLLNISPLQRLLPSYIVGLTVISLTLFIASMYEPPPKSARLWPDMPPAAATYVGLLALNLAVFVAWRVPQCWRILNRYFLQTPGYPVAMSALLNTFSHQSFGHLALNMGTLFFILPPVHDAVLNRANFFSLYISSGVMGSLTSLTYFTLTRNFTTISLGASGAICGVITACLLICGAPVTWLNNEKIRIPILDVDLPWTSLLLWPIFVGGEILALRRGSSGYDHAAHFGGYIVGTLWGFLWLKINAKVTSKGAVMERKDINQEE